MALSAVALCSRALLKLGAEPISSFEDGTAESMAASLLYGSTRDAVLSAYPWTFATAQKGLARLVGKPVADFQYAYQLPPDFLRILSAGEGGRSRGIDYQIIENRLHTDAPAVTATYIFRPYESMFPAYFDQLMILRLAAELCLPLTESTSRAESMLNLAEKEFRKTKSIDAQQDTPQSIEGFNLIEGRY
ncbi:hypothetical protein [Curvivirga aplysinae]|uniref:hypothetical protein n=1 Tax=Curvivirga aplysinae TaxID=2529852 RepID=UPI0012BC687B|nr:hypothetical protein [Curvivirga aplysinae]MTI08489.1 hypothetical protein [Curvivirga aplysinae]